LRRLPIESDVRAEGAASPQSEIPVLICLDDLRGPEIAVFLEEHLEDMRAISPPESKHALDLDGLRRPGIAFWTEAQAPGNPARGLSLVHRE
jgi:putative acetyltransferase